MLASWFSASGHQVYLFFFFQVYGQCKAMFHMNKPSRVLYLLAYNCTLRPGKGRGGGGVVHFNKR